MYISEHESCNMLYEEKSTLLCKWIFLKMCQYYFHGIDIQAKEQSHLKGSIDYFRKQVLRKSPTHL